MEYSLQNTLKNFFSENQQFLDELVLHWDKDVVIGRKERLIHFGEKENQIYYIEKGTCIITYPDQDEDRILGFGYPGTFLFSPSILSGTTSKQEVIAIKKMTLKAIRQEHFFAFIENYSEAKNNWIKQLQNLLVAQIDRQVDLLITSPQERYQRLLDRSPHVFQFIPNKYIASYLRMTPETFSRLQNS